MSQGQKLTSLWGPEKQECNSQKQDCQSQMEWPNVCLELADLWAGENVPEAELQRWREEQGLAEMLMCREHCMSGVVTVTLGA